MCIYRIIKDLHAFYDFYKTIRHLCDIQKSGRRPLPGGWEKKITVPKPACLAMMSKWICFFFIRPLVIKSKWLQKD